MGFVCVSNVLNVISGTIYQKIKWMISKERKEKELGLAVINVSAVALLRKTVNCFVGIPGEN